ncbi:hypothetical protein ACIQI7_23055 [Kitasatospora sp. NPDC092039]|uniref:hypothetical protein n=1 Tax=Kitasatospora sp. NPDC092039 TaxID=3364086 RepID=UPI00381387CA
MSAEHDGPDEWFEQAFTEAIGRAGGAYDADATRLVDTGWAYGRRLRRRRRAGTVAGAAALALIGVGGAALGGLLPGQGAAVVGAASDGASTASAPPVTGPEFLQMFTELLPQGAVTVDEARGTENDIPQLRLVLDDGNGAVQYLFWIALMAGDADCPTTTVPGDACTEADLPGGEHVRVYQAGTRGDEPAGSKTWSAKLTGSGYQILLQEWNRKPLENGSPVTRTDPPLTPDQLTAVVKDPRWKKVVAAVPDPNTGRPAVPPPVPPGSATSPATPPPVPPGSATSPATPPPVPPGSATSPATPPPVPPGSATSPATPPPGS